MQCSVEFDRGLTAKESCDEIQSLPSQCWNLREEKVVYLVNNSLNYWCSRVLICRLLRNRWTAPTQFRVIFKGDESRSTWFIPAISKRERSSFKNGHVDFLSDFFFIALVDRQRWNEGAPVDRFKAARIDSLPERINSSPSWHPMLLIQQDEQGSSVALTMSCPTSNRRLVLTFLHYTFDRWIIDVSTWRTFARST